MDVRLLRYNFGSLRSKVVEISQSSAALFCGEVGEDGNAGHGFCRRLSFFSARIVFDTVIIIAGDDDRFVRLAFAYGYCDRKEVA